MSGGVGLAVPQAIIWSQIYGEYLAKVILKAGKIMIVVVGR